MWKIIADFGDEVNVAIVAGASCSGVQKQGRKPELEAPATMSEYTLEFSPA
jgi:hypothetical protein